MEAAIRKRSDVATPGTQAISSPHSTTGSDRRRSRGTLRSVKRSPSVRVPPETSGAIRSPARHARTSRRSPSAPASRTPSRGAGGRRPRAHLPGAEARLTGHARFTAAGAAGAGRRRSAARRTRRPRAARRRSRQLGRSRRGAQRDQLREPLGGVGRRAARRVLGQPSQHEPGQRRRERRPARARATHDGREHVVDQRVEHVGLVAQRARRAHDVALGRRVNRRAAPARAPLAHARARKRGRRWRRPRARPGRAPRQYAAVCSRVISSSGRTSRPSRAGMPSSARRPGEAASR